MHSTESGGGNLVGEDAATFDLKEQSLKVRTFPLYNMDVFLSDLE
jgi:hypothetical protein